VPVKLKYSVWVKEVRGSIKVKVADIIKRCSFWLLRAAE
jgi:hypothetical protein